VSRDQFILEADRHEFGAWLAGFTDSKGHFVLGYTMVGEQEVPTAQFMIAVRSDDEEVLEKIRSYLGVGQIDRREDGGYDRQGRRVKRTSVYCVTDINDLHDVIIPHFETYPPIIKQREFRVWRQGVDLCYRVSKRGEPDDE
jgi:hypothetical protein